MENMMVWYPLAYMISVPSFWIIDCIWHRLSLIVPLQFPQLGIQNLFWLRICFKRSVHGAVNGETDHESSCLGRILGHLLHMEPSRTKASVFFIFLKMWNVEKMQQQKSLLYEAAERMNAIPACGWGTQVHLDRMDLPIWTEFSVWVPT